MATIVQTKVITGAWSGSFTSNVTPGSTVFLYGFQYSSSSVTMGSSNPTFAGSAVGAASKVLEKQFTGANCVCGSVWMLPNLAGGSAAVSLTNSGGTVDSNVGMIAVEVAGLGASPAVDSGASPNPQSASGTSTAPASGATGNTTQAPGIALAMSVGFAQVQTGPGAPWTTILMAASNFGAAAYQTYSSAGSSYSYTASSGSNQNWAAGVVAIAASAAAAPARQPPPQLPPVMFPPMSRVFGPNAPFEVGQPFPAPAAASPGAATITGQGALSTAAAVAAGATMAGQGSLAASTTPYIAGLGGTGAGWFVDNSGKPRMVLGDAAWALPGNAGRWNSGNWQADYDTYLANRAGQGFTVIYTKPIGTTQSGNIDDNGATFDSLYPFQGGAPSTGTAGANPSSGLTAAFWARIDYMLASALAKGITVFFNAIGYDSDFSSGPGPLFGKSTTEFTAYGTALGTRYAAQPNLVWHLADDYFGENDALITAFMSGVRGAGDTHLVSVENFPETTSRQDISNSSAITWGAANAQYNFCYSYNVTYYSVEKAYLESSPIPVIWGDGYFYQGSSSYAGGSGAFAFDRAVRQDAWHAISSGARGWINGAEDIWQWPSTALAKSATDWWYANNAGVIRAVMEALPGWHTLVPDTSSALVTSGRGTHASTFSSGGGGGQYEVAFTDSYVTASRGPDSGSGASLAVIYLSHATTIGIDQTKMVSGYIASWVDPVSGAATPATVGASYNSGSQGNNSKGDPDWVLVLQANTIVAGAATIAGQGAVSTAAATAAPATLAGQGGLSGTDTEAAPATLTGSSSLTGADGTRAGVTLSGQGAVGPPGVTQAAASTISGQGQLPGTATAAAPAALTGQGALSGADVEGGGGGVAGQGNVGPPAAVIAAPGTITGQGQLAASTSPQGASGLTGQGAIAVPAAILAPGTLAGQGTLGLPVLAVAAAALLQGAGQLAAAGTGTGGGQGAGTMTGQGVLAAPVVVLAVAAIAGQGRVTAATIAVVVYGTARAGAGTAPSARTGDPRTDPPAGYGTAQAGTWP